jgi:hypothetical protein
LWKSEWNEGDQMLAMYNSLYGIEDLGMGNKQEIAENIIGSSLASFNQQSSNFDFLSGKGGLDRPHSLQSPVWEKYKDLSKTEFKRLCLEIIQKRLENPEEAAVNKKLGQEIGSKRDEITKARREALIKAGVNPDKQTMIGTRPKDLPVEDEPEKPTEKEQIQNFLRSIQDRLKNINTKEDAIILSNQLEFVIEYIDNELTDKNMVAEITNIIKNKNIITESKVVKEFKRITEIMKNL